jgi:hypothetical protein
MGGRLSALLNLPRSTKVPEGEEWLVPWSRIDDYEDLVFVNGAYVAGRISASPYRYSPWPRYRHDSKAIPKLITLQRYGLVTVGYQPGYPVENQPMTVQGKQQYFLSQRRRTFVSFFVPKKEKLLNAVYAMFKQPDQYYVSISDSDSDKSKPEVNFTGHIVLIEDKTADTIGELSRKPYEEGVVIYDYERFRTIESFGAFPNIVDALANTFCVTIVSALPFGQGDVLDDLHTQLAINKNFHMYDVKM